MLVRARPGRLATIRRRHMLPPKRLDLDRSPMRAPRQICRPPPLRAERCGPVLNRLLPVHARPGRLATVRRRHMLPPKRLDLDRSPRRRLREGSLKLLSPPQHRARPERVLHQVCRPPPLHAERGGPVLTRALRVHAGLDRIATIRKRHRVHPKRLDLDRSPM